MNLNLATPFRGNLFHNDEATSMAAQMSCQLMSMAAQMSEAA